MTSLAKLIFILLFFLKPFDVIASQIFESQITELNNKLYSLEIADTQSRKRQGLMFRQTLNKQSGMLFIYTQPGSYRIWMKNTLIPLTVIWLDQQAVVIDKKILQPCRVDDCPVSGTTALSKYILELHPDEFDRFQIGDKLQAIIK